MWPDAEDEVKPAKPSPKVMIAVMGILFFGMFTRMLGGRSSVR
jgi:hypothetical protein